MKRLAFAALSVSAVVVACGGATADPDTTEPRRPLDASAEADSAVCDSLSSAAAYPVQQLFDDNNGCKVDADCISLPFAGDCFDLCWRTIAASAAAQVAQATAYANAHACVAFRENGCTVYPANCVPLGPAKCLEGSCGF